MTTIAINESIVGLPKNNFDSLEELFMTLRKISPIQLFHVDADEFPPDVMGRIEKSRNNPNKKLTIQ